MPDVVRHYPANSNIKQQRASNMFHYTLARLETRQRKINDLHRAVANPFAAHCSSWVKATLPNSVSASQHDAYILPTRDYQVVDFPARWLRRTYTTDYQIT
jgi:hypothetical protein